MAAAYSKLDLKDQRREILVVAAIGSASTRFLHRGRGVQSALIAARLTCASEAGCKVAFSIANADGPSERNLRRFGFTFLQEGRIFIKP